MDDSWRPWKSPLCMVSVTYIEKELGGLAKFAKFLSLLDKGIGYLQLYMCVHRQLCIAH